MRFYKILDETNNQIITDVIMYKSIIYTMKMQPTLTAWRP